MCTLILCEQRKLNQAEFDTAWMRNPHGFGISFVDDKGLFVKKGLMIQNEAWDYYDKKVNVLPHVIHFRFRSIGEIIPEMTHPFVVSTEDVMEGYSKDPVLFHNGSFADYIHLAKEYDIPLKKETSDTKILAKAYGILGKEIFSKLKHYGKIIVMNPNGEIKLYGDFLEKKDGIIASNSNYIPIQRASLFSVDTNNSIYRDAEYGWYDEYEDDLDWDDDSILAYELDDEYDDEWDESIMEEDDIYGDHDFDDEFEDDEDEDEDYEDEEFRELDSKFKDV